MGGEEAQVRPEDVLVLIQHPFGDTWPTLTEWMEYGPGPRKGLRPVAARSRLTGEELPLTVIPLPYRNDEESRAAIQRGELADPWAGHPSPPARPDE
ncbi:hypothetical protein [Actinomadura violacea]|uniref:Uncharacterized protein n=1 Tax=Actinomadura violacea TaxID=2819934 RepID=A0ABS3SAH0_9ACTN|nr:hypothetical protein [Actinomadura violacea]MBO2465190.1 hypothetical protein [Actinomadura violacea]